MQFCLHAALFLTFNTNNAVDNNYRTWIIYWNVNDSWNKQWLKPIATEFHRFLLGLVKKIGRQTTFVELCVSPTYMAVGEKIWISGNLFAENDIRCLQKMKYFAALNQQPKPAPNIILANCLFTLHCLPNKHLCKNIIFHSLTGQ